MSKLPQKKAEEKRKKFKLYPIGYFRLDVAKVRTEKDKLHLFAAIGRTSKLAYAELHLEATQATAKKF